MPLPLSRRQFLALSVTGAFGAGGYGLTRAMQKVRDVAKRMAES